MSRFPISFFAGEDWDDARMIAQTYAVAVPRKGDHVFIKNTTDEAVDYPVQEVRHEFTGDEQTIKVLLKRHGPSVYETRGVRFL